MAYETPGWWENLLGTGGQPPETLNYPMPQVDPTATTPVPAANPYTYQPNIGPNGGPPVPAMAQKPGQMPFVQMMQIMKMLETPQGARMGQTGAGHAQGMPTRQYQAAMVNTPALQAPPTLAALLAGRR